MLQEGQFERLGGTTTLSVDVRILAASKKNLADEVAAGRFREDLFYRLNVIQMELPPLRERREDIPLLANHFLRIYTDKNNRNLRGIQREAMAAMSGYNWPGNVRNLRIRLRGR